VDALVCGGKDKTCFLDVYSVINLNAGGQNMLTLLREALVFLLTGCQCNIHIRNYFSGIYVLLQATSNRTVVFKSFTSKKTIGALQGLNCLDFNKHVPVSSI